MQAILTVQSSTAEVERIYSMYTHRKTPQRYSLAVNTVEAIVRTKFNGPKSLKDFEARKYAQKFLQDHSRADDDGRRRACKKKGSELDEASEPKKSKISDTSPNNLGELTSVETMAEEVEYQMEVDEDESVLSLPGQNE